MRLRLGMRVLRTWRDVIWIFCNGGPAAQGRVETALGPVGHLQEVADQLDVLGLRASMDRSGDCRSGDGGSSGGVDGAS